MMRLSSALAASLIGASPLLPAGHAVRGEAPRPNALQAAPAPFAQCKACHTVNRGGPALVGPNLFGIGGAPAASKPGYAYSPAMKGAKLRWDRARLDAYLADPKAVVPGTKMAIPGIKDAAKRKEIIDYLATLK